MGAYSEFFLKSKRSVVQLECVSISHPNFVGTYNLVRNAGLGVTVTLEDSSVVEYRYLPMTIKQKTIKDDLDLGFEFQLGDIGEDLEKEVRSLTTATLTDSVTGFAIKPTVIYRQYRSDNLSEPMFGPVVLQMQALTYNRKGCAFTALVPQLNLNKTGEIYTLDRFPMLRGFASYSTYYSPPAYLDFVDGSRLDFVSGDRFELG